MDFPTNLYACLLGRAPDYDGYLHWSAMPRSVTANAFAGYYVVVNNFAKLPSDQIRKRALANAFYGREPIASDSRLGTSLSAWSKASDNLAFQPQIFHIRRNAMPKASIGVDVGMVSTASELITALDRANTSVNKVVTLSRGAIIILDKPLVVPPFVTLRSAPLATPVPYEKPMIIGTHDWRVVTLSEGASLEDVWVAGSRWSYSVQPDQDQNIPILAHAGASVHRCWVSNYKGFTGIYTAPGLAPTYVNGNFVDASSSFRVDGLWSDGISVEATNTTVCFNTVVEATDVAIISFGSRTQSGLPQRSIIRDNIVFNSSQRAFIGISFDPGLVTNSPVPKIDTIDFTGSEITRNIIISPKPNGIVYGITAGVSPWFQNMSNLGWGGKISKNVLSGGFTVALYNLGMVRVTYEGNDTFNLLGGNAGKVRYNYFDNPFPEWYEASSTESDISTAFKILP